MIKTILFDLGRTIIPFDFGRGYAALADLCACPAEEVRRRVSTTDLFERFELGQVAPHDFVDGFCHLLDCRIDYDKFCELWGIIFLPETLIPASRILGLKSEYRLLSLSNTNAIHFPIVLRDYPFLNRFDDHVLSFRVGAMKPSPRIYQAAIAMARCRAEECLFIDDIAGNIEAARREGMGGIVFESAEQLDQELSSRGIRW